MELVSIFGAIFNGIYQILNIEFTIFGYTFSLWNVFAFTFVTSVVAWLVWEVILGDE